jgi:protein O-mannosyl-transferase
LFSVGTGSVPATSTAPEVQHPMPERVRTPMFSRLEKQTLILCLALFASTLLFYNPISHDGFILLDDVPYILSNPPVKAGLTWSTVKWAFTTFHAGYWHPLTWLSHALDCQLFGLNPAGHHYVSLLFHAANAVLLFLVLEEATLLVWPSLIVAAIFALHPINVESVAWAAERKNVLSMFFFLFAMLAYGRYARRGGKWNYLAVNVSFVLGMMAKPQIITLPFVLLLWDYWPLKRMFAQRLNCAPDQPRPRSLGFLLLEKVPLFLIVLGGSILTFKAQQYVDAVRTLGEFSLRARLENALVSYAKYLRLLVWPWHLAPLYPHPGNGIPKWQVGLSCAVLLVLTAIALRWRERRYLAMGWLWFLGILVPMIGIVQVGEQAMADRFVYIPMIGVLIAVVWAVWEFAEWSAISKISVVAPSAMIVLALGTLTYHQLGYWKSGETLWRYTLTVTHDNYMAHDNLAMVLKQQGRVEEAIPEFIVAESLHKYPLPEVFNMGVYLQQFGHVPDAMRMYEKVVAESSDPQLRAMAFSEMGAANAQLGDYERATTDYQQAVQLNPKNAAALLGSALLAEHSGNSTQAIAQLQLAANVAPNDGTTLLLLGDMLERSGRTLEAQRAEQSAEKMSSDLIQARLKAAELEKLFDLPPLHPAR